VRLELAEEQRHRAEEILAAAGARQNVTRIAIGAGASYGSAKCWPPDRFADFVNRFRRHTDGEVILFGTPSEQTVSDAIAAGIEGPSISLVGKTALADLPALLARCHFFVGNDSGAMHVAAAVGLPVVAIFGPTDPHGTAPITPRCTVVQEKPYCSPCFLRRCPIDHRCMTSVTSESVEAAALASLRATEVASG
jgi:heptosyltransferase-2